MPMSEFFCEGCKKTVGPVLTMKDRDGGNVTCPHCKGKTLEPLMTGFFAKTSRKS